MTERFVKIVEVGPRDGLQNEAELIAIEDKIRLVDCLSLCGFLEIEAGAFVSPKWVPQMAGSAEVIKGIVRKSNVKITALTPNNKGLEGALDAGVDGISIFAAASETFSQKNANATIAQSIDRFKALIPTANQAGIPVRGYISTVVDCPYEGPVAPKTVADVAMRLLDLGVREISLGDTTGRATPETLRPMLDAVLGIAPAEMLAGHYHDTGGQAIDNILTSLNFGLRVFDTAVGGLGGCPYAPGAKGNVNTRHVVEALTQAGWQTGIDLSCLTQAEAVLNDLLPGRVGFG